MAQEAQVAQAGRFGDCQGVGGQSVEGVRGGIVGRIALAVAPMVERHHPVVTRQRVDVVVEVFLRATEAVDEQQTGSVRWPCDHRRQHHAVVDGDPHAPNLRPGERAANEAVT